MQTVESVFSIYATTMVCIVWTVCIHTHSNCGIIMWIYWMVSTSHIQIIESVQFIWMALAKELNGFNWDNVEPIDSVHSIDSTAMFVNAFKMNTLNCFNLQSASVQMFRLLKPFRCTHSTATWPGPQTPLVTLTFGVTQRSYDREKPASTRNLRTTTWTRSSDARFHIGLWRWVTRHKAWFGLIKSASVCRRTPNTALAGY
jgi:hypothetical protein